MAAGIWAGSCKKCDQNRKSVVYIHSNSVLSLNMKSLLVNICIVLYLANSVAAQDCYNYKGEAQRCMPEFVNAAFNLSVEATNTCGVTRVTDYCLQTGVTGARQYCHKCDARTPGLTHPPEFMTDLNTHTNWTWWQSETMLEGVQYPTTVNLTLHLRKAFDVTYVRLRFHSPRPESFAIYKLTTEDGDWIPYQYYSASCERTYNLTRRGIILPEQEDAAICSDDYSDISPLTGGSVPFSTLEGRPSAYDYENSPVLQEWVTATNIRIVLTRMNTFGDEVFGDSRVLMSYFYAISDLAVGGRCKCNGHASECVYRADQGLQDRLVCRCEHNTMGPDCEECLPFYNDRPWFRATETDAHECLPCDCNGNADRCYFDSDLYHRTGHGGHCIDCRDNTAGANCEHCKENHYHHADSNRCVRCGCDPIGSESLQCGSDGRCPCKPGVTGDRCDRCEVNHFDFGPGGCRPCGCTVAGSQDNNPHCDPSTGLCTCKETVEGQNCDRCKPGYFGLAENNPYGCISCFCYSHSSVCTSATGFYPTAIASDFQTGKQRWVAVDQANEEIPIQYNGILQNIGVSAPGNLPIYFVAPARYLGDQRSSYNQYLTFTLRIGEGRPRASILDVVLEGGRQRVSSAIFGQGNPVPGVETQEYRFRLNENINYQWTPRLKAQDFIAILSNLTAIKIRATYNVEDVGFVDDIRLETARQLQNGDAMATWVEQCTCPEGYIGQFCESCAPGYKRDPAFGTAFAQCIPCECYSHSDVCDVDSGRCICKHNTFGDNCERCATGYYGDARQGTEQDCQACPCPDGGPCTQLPDGDVFCTECPEGYAGNHCDICLDGYYGDPLGRYGEPRACQRCSCNENIDPNAVGNCDRVSGACLKCIHNTAGEYCELCLPSYYGDALALPKGNCRACDCYPPGTISAGVLSCDPTNGQCPCLPNVQGRQCDQCESGYWNLDSGKGCEPCLCSREGSTNNTCNLRTGQCMCRPGVTGLQCDLCQRYHFGFSITGCQACNCDLTGSLDMQCDEYGNCPCREGVEGMRCNRCLENRYNMSAGCINCPPCYSLVQERVNIHRGKLRDLHHHIITIGTNPDNFNDTEFLNRMNEVNDSIVLLLDEARGSGGGDGTLGAQLLELKTAVNDVMMKSGQISSNIKSADESAQNSESDVSQAEEAIKRAKIALLAAENYIDSEGQAVIDRAKQALERHGQQSELMTQMALKAKQAADRHSEEADMIDSIARDALNTSREALRMAQETLFMPDQISSDIQRLRQKSGDVERLFEQTRIVAENAKDYAEKAYKEALDLYTEATSLQLPGIDVATIGKDADQIKKDANVIKERAKQLIRENEELLEDVDKQMAEAETLLDSGIIQQQTADGLLADVDAARAMARQAVDKGTETLNDAQETLDTLKGFDNQVQVSKDKAEEALTRVPDILEVIEQAESTTKEAQDALSGAESDAKMALSVAKKAQETAENASTEASRIRVEADKTRDRALDLKDDADHTEATVRTVEQDMEEYEKQAKEDEELVEDALEKANTAKLTADDVSSKVGDALDTVNSIIQVLARLVVVDTDKLDALERDLDEAERQLQESDLDQHFNDLQNANNRVKELTNDYTLAIEELRMEVQNIQDINNALPEGCYKNDKTEYTIP